MKKKLLSVLLLLPVLVTACAGGGATPASTTAAQAPTQETQPTQSAPAATAKPGCTVVSPRPTPGPTQQSLFPPIGENDWTLGETDASVQIVEYSDFQ